MAGFAQVAVLRQDGADSDSASARPGRRAASGGPPAVRRRGPAVGPGALPQLAGGWAGQLAGQLAGHLCRYCICWYRVSTICLSRYLLELASSLALARAPACHGQYVHVCVAMTRQIHQKCLSMKCRYVHVCACICWFCWYHVSMCSYYKTTTLKMSKYEL